MLLKSLPLASALLLLNVQPTLGLPAFDIIEFAKTCPSPSQVYDFATANSSVSILNDGGTLNSGRFVIPIAATHNTKLFLITFAYDPDQSFKYVSVVGADERYPDSTSFMPELTFFAQNISFQLEPYLSYKEETFNIFNYHYEAPEGGCFSNIWIKKDKEENLTFLLFF